MEMNWDNARAWEKKANIEHEDNGFPKWSFDCGFKLDYDGGLLSVESRFYPPHMNNHDGWEGGVRINLLFDNLIEKTFKTDSLDDLKDQVEDFLKGYIAEIKHKL